MSIKIKAFLSIMTLAALTACGDGCIETVTSSEVVTAPVVMPEPIPAPVVIAPTPTPVCSAGMPNCPPPEGMELCDIWSYIPCAVPTWIPKQPTTPAPEPICVRDLSIALVLVNEVLTDNCGNTYGQVNG